RGAGTARFDGLNRLHAENAGEAIGIRQRRQICLQTFHVDRMITDLPLNTRDLSNFLTVNVGILTDYQPNTAVFYQLPREMSSFYRPFSRMPSCGSPSLPAAGYTTAAIMRESSSVRGEQPAST